MIENIRKYNGLVILGIVVVAVALIVGLQSSNVNNMSGGTPYLKIAGRSYNGQEYEKYGVNSMSIIQSLARSGDYSLFQFIIGLTTRAQTQDEQAEQFFIGRMLIRNAKNDFGVQCTEDEISSYIKNLRTFSGPDGSFDAQAYQMFAERGLGSLGMTKKDFRELISDIIAFEKISDIVGAGLKPSGEAVAHNLALDEQSISGELGRIDITPFEEAVEPTDQELKAYWELIQDAYKTEPRRKFTYIIATADLPKEETVEEDEAPEDSIVEAAKTEKQKAEEEKAKADAKAKKEATLAELRRTKQLEVDRLVNEFITELEEEKGEGFEKIAEKHGLEVKTTELFSATNPPADLNTPLRANANTDGGRAVNELFKIVTTVDPISKISEPIPIAEHGWIVARLEEVEESRVKTFEEAQSQVLEQYIREKSTDALRDAANMAAEKIREELANGKSFAEASKAAGITETTSFVDITSMSQPKPYTQPKNLFQAAREVDPKSLADPVIETNSAFLVYVSERTWNKGDDAENDLVMEIERSTRQNADIAFTSWLGSSIETANIERLYQQ